MSITDSISGLGRPVAFYPTISRAFQSNDTALIVCQFLYWRSRVGSRWIFKTQEDIEQETCVPAHTQRRIFKRLSSMGFVEIKKKGVPAKNHYFWNWEAVDKFVSDYILSLQQSVSTSGDNLLGLDVTNSKHKTKQNVTTITKTTTETTHTLKTLSSKPDRVAEIIDYLNQQASTGFKHAKSHQRLINARLKEGHTVEDIKTVVDRKVAEWANTKMAKYLRPSTLFSDTNFNNYIGQITVGSDHEGNQQYNNQLTAEQERRARLSKYPAGRIQLQIEDRLAAEQRRDSILVVDNEQDIRPSLDFQSGRRD